MEEVLLMAVVEALHELPHDAGVVKLTELYHPRLQEAHQVMVQVLKHQVERPFVLHVRHEENT